eukprot:1158604-Pelagomonas_calceolata.AAC.2
MTTELTCHFICKALGMQHSTAKCSFSQRTARGANACALFPPSLNSPAWIGGKPAPMTGPTRMPTLKHADMYLSAMENRVERSKVEGRRASH